MIADPMTKHLCENGDTFNGWIGPDVHFLVSSIKDGQDMCWVLTHKVRSPFAQLFMSQFPNSNILIAVNRMNMILTNHGRSLVN